MKILIITLQYPPQTGGIASFTFNIAKHWPNQKDVFVYAPRVKGGPLFDKLHRWKVFRRKYSFIKSLWQIRKICRNEKIDLLHLHHVYATGLGGLLFKKLFKIPYRIFLHSCDFNYIKKNSRRKNKLKRICRSAEQIFVNSRYLQAEFKRYFEDIGKETTIIYPCPSDIFFQPAEPETVAKLRSSLALEGKKIILTVARLDEGKGYPRLIHMLPRVLERVPNMVWVIIGEGPKTQSFISLIQKNNLQNVIRYIGNIPQAELLQYYKLADLFVLLTHPDNEAEEDWGTVFVEASATGLPILAGQVGGVDEAVQDGRTGIIVDVNREEKVVNSIIRLLNNKEQAATMGEIGQQWVEENFKWEDQIKKMLF